MTDTIQLIANKAKIIKLHQKFGLRIELETWVIFNVIKNNRPKCLYCQKKCANLFNTK